MKNIIAKAKPTGYVAKVNPEMLRVLMALLSLKNMELQQRGNKLGNQPDLIWYERQLRRLRIRTTLLQIHHNLKRLFRAGVLDFEKEILEYGFKGKSKIFNKYIPSKYPPTSFLKHIWSDLIDTLYFDRRTQIETTNHFIITNKPKSFLHRLKRKIWR